MSKGSKIVPVRIEPELMTEILHCIHRRNAVTRDTPWNLSEFIRKAIAEKLAHMQRSRRPLHHESPTTSTETETCTPT